MPVPAVDGFPAVYRAFADGSGISPFAVARTGLRYEGRGARDLLTLMASGGDVTFAGLQDLAAQVVNGSSVSIDGLSSDPLYALCLLLAGDASGSVTQAQTADMFALARAVAGKTGARRQEQNLDLQVNFAEGRHDYVRKHLWDHRVSPSVRWGIATDMLRSGTAEETVQSRAWLSSFNKELDVYKLDRVRVAPGDGEPFDRLTTVGEVSPRTVDGPLVSIVVSVFKPTVSLLTAVRSLVNQTWKNLQIIIVDDATPEGYESLFEQAQALDDCVEYVRSPVNGGTYKSRNLGISLSRGEFVGFQDGDDWSHPERIERQLRPLMSEPAVTATLSMAIRVYSDLSITKVGSNPVHEIAPSLLYRRAVLHERLGDFDDVRKAADNEFHKRIKTVYGPDALQTVCEPLSLYQLTDGSLSRADFRIGWHRHARVSYHSSYGHWHQRIADREVDPRLDKDHPRTFPAPPEFLGESHPQSTADVVVLADWRRDITTSSGLSDEVRALVEAGLTVRLARAELMRFANVRRIYPDPSVLELVENGETCWVPLSEDTPTRTLIVRDPELLTFAPHAGVVGLRPEQVVVIADRAPRQGAGAPTFDPAQVEDVVRELFGCGTSWLPALPGIAEALVADGAEGVVHRATSAQVVSTARFPRRFLQGKPVVGACDQAGFDTGRLTEEDFTSWSRGGSDLDLRVLSSARPTSRSGAGSNWLRFDAREISIREFSDLLDFCVFPPSTPWNLPMVHPALEAMASGCVVILDPVYEPYFGAAGLYLGEQSLSRLVKDMWSDPSRFEAQQRIAMDFCRTHHSAANFVAVIKALIDTEGTS